MYKLNSFWAVFFVVVVVVDVQGAITNKRFPKAKIFDDVKKRNLLQFGAMITCTTKRLATDFVGYGNYCGLGGSGAPVDDIDRCCQVHDQCFGANSHCFPKWITYNGGFIKQWRTSTQNCIITCDDTDTCKYNVCECDRIAAECFAKYTYNANHKKSWWGKRK